MRTQHRTPIRVAVSQFKGKHLEVLATEGQLDLTLDDESGHTLSISSGNVTFSVDLDTVLRFLQKSAEEKPHEKHHH